MLISLRIVDVMVGIIADNIFESQKQSITSSNFDLIRMLNISHFDGRDFNKITLRCWCAAALNSN